MAPQLLSLLTPLVLLASSVQGQTQFMKDVLNTSNQYRAMHSAPALKWNTTSATFAQNWANGCVFQHSNGATGENLAAGFNSTVSAIQAWGDEGRMYNYSNPGFSEDTGHFTQLVWIATTSVGCATKACNGQNGTPGTYLVCEYWPRGNFAGQYPQNVKPS